MNKLEFTDQQLNVILQSLAKQPYEVVAELINEIHKQYNEQKNDKNKKG